MSKRNAILAAAASLFSTNGFKGTSMAELSRITGAAGGTIFHHFKNKEDLFLNILGDLKETILAKFDSHLATSHYNSGLEMVEGVVTFYLRLSEDMEDRFLLLHRHYPYQMAVTNSVCRQHLEAILDCLLDIFEKGIVAGQKDGTVKTMPPRHTAMVLFAMADGIVRLNTYHLYNAGALYNDLMTACRKILTTGQVAV